MLPAVITDQSDIPGEMTCGQYRRLQTLLGKHRQPLLRRIRKVFWVSERELVMQHLFERMVRAWNEERYQDAQHFENTYTMFEAMSDSEYTETYTTEEFTKT